MYGRNIFDEPSVSERYDAAILELHGQAFLDGHVVEDIARYVTLLRQRLAKTDDVYNMRFR